MNKISTRKQENIFTPLKEISGNHFPLATTNDLLSTTVKLILDADTK